MLCIELSIIYLFYIDAIIPDLEYIKLIMFRELFSHQLR